MRTILAHLEISPVLDSVLACGLLAARQFDAYLEGLHVRPSQPDVIAAGADGFIAAAPDLVAGFEREAKERAEAARRRFEDFMTREGLRRPALAGSGLAADWRIESKGGHGALGSHARVFDLLVVGRPLPDSVAPSMAALESALFDSGRPLLIAPPTPPRELGRRIVIHWNRSTESARTVAFAMPFLRRAERVAIVAVQKSNVPGPPPADLALALERNGIAVSWKEIAPGERGPGHALLAEAALEGADLMIKGAYTQSRLRQMIFGGATSQILAAADIPVFMAN